VRRTDHGAAERARGGAAAATPAGSPALAGVRFAGMLPRADYRALLRRARVFAARACTEVARRQPRPLSVVYGYPGTFVSNGEPVEVHAAVGEDGVALTGHAVVAADAAAQAQPHAE